MRREYLKINSEKIKAQKHTLYLLNGEKVCKRARERYHTNKEEICKNSRERYHLHRITKITTKPPTKQDILRALRVSIEELSCHDCGLPFDGQYWIADFHHIEQKSCKKGIYSCISSVARLFSELNRGIFLCPTCHRIRHRYSGVVKW